MVEIGLRGPLATVIAVVVPLAIFALIGGVTILVVRRTAPSSTDEAVDELRDRFARGEITEAEFQARMDALTKRT